MKSRKVSPETDNVDKNTNKSSGWRKVVTKASFALAA
jgi:hypothetical protein